MGCSWRPVAGAVAGLSHQTDLTSIVRAPTAPHRGRPGSCFRAPPEGRLLPIAPAPGACAGAPRRWIPRRRVSPGRLKTAACRWSVGAPLSVEAGQRTWIRSPATLRHTTAGSSWLSFARRRSVPATGWANAKEHDLVPGHAAPESPTGTATGTGTDAEAPTSRGPGNTAVGDRQETLRVREVTPSLRGTERGTVGIATDGDLSGVSSRHNGRDSAVATTSSHTSILGEINTWDSRWFIRAAQFGWPFHPPTGRKPRTCGWEHDRLLFPLPLDHPMTFSPDRSVAPHRRDRHLGHDRAFRRDRYLGACPSLCRSEICGPRHLVGSHVPRHVRAELALFRGHSGHLYRLRPPGAVATTMAAGGDTGNVGHRDHAHRPGLRGQLRMVCLL